MWKEFKEFAMRPTLVEVAVGLVMALALKSVVDSLIEHVIMPIVGIIFGEPSFDQALVLTINDSQIRLGSFLTAAVAFISIAFAVFFFIIKPYKAFVERTKDPEPEPEPEADPEDLVLLREIRDALRIR